MIEATGICECGQLAPSSKEFFCLLIFFKAFCYSLATLCIQPPPGTEGGEESPFCNLEDNWVILHRRTQKLEESPTSVGQGGQALLAQTQSWETCVQDCAK